MRAARVRAGRDFAKAVAREQAGHIGVQLLVHADAARAFHFDLDELYAVEHAGGPLEHFEGRALGIDPERKRSRTAGMPLTPGHRGGALVRAWAWRAAPDSRVGARSSFRGARGSRPDRPAPRRTRRRHLPPLMHARRSVAPAAIARKLSGFASTARMAARDADCRERSASAPLSEPMASGRSSRANKLPVLTIKVRSAA